MEKDIVIKIEGLNKKFCRNLKRSMFYGCVDIARDMFGISYDRSKLRPGEFWALKDISFELKKGEALGIIGQNGSGKTTLLRLINGIFPPDSGKISVRGRMGALIAVGAGFHPHMTAKENIYLNGTILGMTRKEIDLKYQEIIDFADIGEFIDAPVSTYSSGMTVRLGFSIAIHSNPEILLADEVLAVGDLSFVLKCHRKIVEYREKGGSIMLVSHSMQLVRNICDRVIYMEKGAVIKEGGASEVCDFYESSMSDKENIDSGNTGSVINTDNLVHIVGVDFLNENGEKIEFVENGSFVKIKINYDCKREVKNPVFGVGISNAEGINVINNFSKNEKEHEGLTIFGAGCMELNFERVDIAQGNYSCTVILGENTMADILDWHEKKYILKVKGSKAGAQGLFQPNATWTLKTK